ncbi:hypothetical protein Desaci_1681 [Desulfosporosinus acidiphilus SJ4]|uniref:Uncharacterized protein n=1 Tax=Desulfosporosinus acidiphilus (strain DSM 22704 / JCM 16185 / SJ4) TaxID=646529 RepID=I4D4F0_DESAJ|nr:hypothetical protein [Desulfosporosinus acidiphilus]AFM40674.1 hypothetical protein Desaci_1681 [Desulfosporosinus acidiphilus SJ4]
MINRLVISQEVESLLSPLGIKVIYNSFESDLIIYLSGCSSNCAQKYSSVNSPCIIVTSAGVNAIAVEEDKIVTEIITRIKRFYEVV